MDIPYTLRKELNILSKELFNVSSKWQKLARGTDELITKQVTETVPGDKGAPDTTREVTVAVLAPNGAKQYRRKEMSPEDIRNFLLELKVKKDEADRQARAKQELAQLAKKLNEENGGAVEV